MHTSVYIIVFNYLHTVHVCKPFFNWLGDNIGQLRPGAESYCAVQAHRGRGHPVVGRNAASPDAATRGVAGPRGRHGFGLAGPRAGRVATRLCRRRVRRPALRSVHQVREFFFLCVYTIQNCMGGGWAHATTVATILNQNICRLSRYR